MSDDIRAAQQEAAPGLEQLAALVGDWALGDPAAPIGRTSFSWLAGGFFLVQRWTVDIPEAPDGIAILGEDAAGGGLVQHYYDSRGIARVYGMSLDERRLEALEGRLGLLAALHGQVQRRRDHDQRRLGDRPRRLSLGA